MPASQQEAHSYQTTPPCLAVLGKREYLPPRDPRITEDYWEVWREEMVVLAIVLQRCAIHARASPNTFCRVVQELCKCLAPVVEGADLFNMEMEILKGARKGFMVPTSPKKAQSLNPEWRNIPVPLYLILHLHPNWKKLWPLRNCYWYWEDSHCHLLDLFLLVLMTHKYHPWKTYAGLWLGS